MLGLTLGGGWGDLFKFILKLLEKSSNIPAYLIDTEHRKKQYYAKEQEKCTPDCIGCVAYSIRHG